MNGTVTAFDFDRGLGEVTAESGEVLPFHCAVIADGTRNIDVGVGVAFEVLLKLGRREATGIRPV